MRKFFLDQIIFSRNYLKIFIDEKWSAVLMGEKIVKYLPRFPKSGVIELGPFGLINSSVTTTGNALQTENFLLPCMI